MNAEKRGVEDPDGRRKPEAQRKREEALEKKYGEGIRNPQQIKSVKEQTSETNEIRYGGTGRASEVLDGKFKATMVKEYGADNPMKVQEFVEKNKNVHTDETKKKISDANKGKISPLSNLTYEEYFGKEKADKLKEDKRKAALNPFLKNIFDQIDGLNIILTEEYINANNLHLWICKTCGNKFMKKWADIKSSGIGCRKCFKNK